MEGRYSELLFRDKLNSSPDIEGPKITIEGENDNVLLDGTVSAKVNWESYSHNGHSIYKAKLDMQDISNQAGTKVDSIYGLWVNERFMIPAMPVNFKNPTDPTTGNPDNPEPSSIWSIEYTAPYDYPLRTMPIYKPGQLGNVSSLIGEHKLNISNLEMTGKNPNYINFKFQLIIRDLKNFTNFIAELKQKGIKFKIIRHEDKRNAFTQKILRYFKKN